MTPEQFMTLFYAATTSVENGMGEIELEYENESSETRVHVTMRKEPWRPALGHPSNVEALHVDAADGHAETLRRLLGLDTDGC